MEAAAVPAVTGVTPYFLPTFACLLATYNNGVRDYNGYEVVRVNTTTIPAFEAIRKIFTQDEFDFWSAPSMHAPTDILVSQGQSKTLKNILSLIGLNYEVMMPNVEKAISTEKLSVRAAGRMSWDGYHRLDVIQNWMDSMASEYPNFVSVENIGKSTENRTLKVMKISPAGVSDPARPAIWIDGGIHAREWITPATTTCMANKIIQESQGEQVPAYLTAFDWYFAPVMNPDGYEYTHTADRLWRKTRSSPNRGIFDSLFGCCKGVDPNRNWNYMWGGKGTSKNQCSQVYAGPNPASEPEVSHVQEYVMERKEQIKLFLTFHSYSQLLLLPWGFDHPRTPDHDEMMAVGLRALEKLKAVHGTEYKAGDTAEILYPAAGGSHDWAKAVAGIKYSYCYELRDTGKHGFMLPANQIKPTCEETYEAVKSMAQDMMQLYKIGQ